MNSEWIDIDVLEDYLDGKLDAKAMHFVERQELEDPFVAEALQGLRQSPKRRQTLSILQRQLHDRLAQKPVKRKLWGINTHRLSIAATATVAFIAVSILFFMRETNRKNAELAAHKANGVIVQLDSSQSVTAVRPLETDTFKPKNIPAAVTTPDPALLKAKGAELAGNNRKKKGISISKSDLSRDQAAASAVATLAERTDHAAVADEVRVTAAPIASGNALAFSGNVVAENGKPIQGAVVKLSHAKAVTATDDKGFFNLLADSTDKNKEILIKAQGFDDKVVVTSPEAIRTALNGNKSLNEIALITGSNGQRKEPINPKKIVLRAVENLDKNKDEVTKPQPVSTINYEQYLENNNRLYHPKGPAQFVILSFTVKKNGRPANVVIIRSLNKKADAEAKRLILSGPDWVLPKNGMNQVEMSIRF